MIHQQICLLLGVLLVLVIQHNFVRMLQMISLEQYRRVIGLYASRTGALIRDMYMLRFVSVYTSASSSEVNHRQFLPLYCLR